MKTKFFPLFFFCIFLCGFYASAQEKVEGQHRIKKSQFPNKAINIITENSDDIKRLKFYREVDTVKKLYTAKFKKYRLFYEMDFDKDGVFKSMGFNIKQIDIPEESFTKIVDFVAKNFEKSKIRKMLQLYPANPENSDEKIIKNAFQNLMMPTMFYKLLVRGKKSGRSADYKVIFDSEGNLKEIQKSLPANRDRVLY